MARETAYRLRAKPGAESFAFAWDRVLGRDGPNRRSHLKSAGGAR